MTPPKPCVSIVARPIVPEQWTGLVGGDISPPYDIALRSGFEGIFAFERLKTC